MPPVADGMRRRAQLWSSRLNRRSPIRSSSWPGFRSSRRLALSASSRSLRSPEPLLSLFPGRALREDAAQPEPAGPSRRLRSEATGLRRRSPRRTATSRKGRMSRVKDHRRRRRTLEGDVEAGFDQQGASSRWRVQRRATRAPRLPTISRGSPSGWIGGRKSRAKWARGRRMVVRRLAVC
jgi:hypothetical protein